MVGTDPAIMTVSPATGGGKKKKLSLGLGLELDVDFRYCLYDVSRLSCLLLFVFNQGWALDLFRWLADIIKTIPEIHIQFQTQP